jgi:hypothetical protein
MSGITHPTSAKKRPTVMLEAYFDESGSAGDPNGAFVLCGYVAPKTEWLSVERKWKTLLDKPCHHPVKTRWKSVCQPLDYLHATEMDGLGTKRFRLLAG